LRTGKSLFGRDGFLDIEKVRDLIRMLENSSLSEIEIEESGQRIKLRKPNPELMASPHVVQALPHPSHAGGYGGQTHALESDSQEDSEPKEELLTINSPMVGVFYTAPAPGEPPFIKPGDQIKANQTVCIVEAMKLMNEVTAKFACTLVRCLVENGEPVEFGQPLFSVRSAEHA
jgi:oxaloacetate decarboxylase (Na+ extruding) subunit alpha